jgi:hypothetical protein
VHRHYADILSRVVDPPLWFDECAVPRFDSFTPKLLANIYASEAALLEISCQSCGERFQVAISRVRDDPSCPTLADSIRAQHMHYGDPPNMRCCPSGPTMSADVLRVLEYWRRESHDWQRDDALAIDLSDD